MNQPLRPDATARNDVGALTRERAARERPTPARSVGLVGGGQLAWMMAPAARALGLELVVLDPDARCPAATEADACLQGEFGDADAVVRLGEHAEVVTFEIERASAAGLERLESAGRRVAPSAQVLTIVQDKLAQKRFLSGHGIPVPAFRPFDPADATPHDLPCVWKARRGGYDGRGVAVVRDEAAAARLPRAEALLEELVDIERELAIMVARGQRGEIVLYPLTEILMDPDAHVLDTVVAPAAVDPRVERLCRELAREIVTLLDYVGVLAIEFFVDRVGDVLVNEISPRPHNSGHYTIEACVTSQFEQHLRAVAGLDLGPADMHCAAATFNVLGRSAAEGRPCAPDLRPLSELPGVFVHDYGKPDPRPGRKLGHVTVTGETAAGVRERARVLRASLEA